MQGRRLAIVRKSNRDEGLIRRIVDQQYATRTQDAEVWASDVLMVSRPPDSGPKPDFYLATRTQDAEVWASEVLMVSRPPDSGPKPDFYLEYFGNLPVEIMMYILRYVGIESFGAIAQANRSFNVTVNDPWLLGKVAPFAIDPAQLYNRNLWAHLLAWMHNSGSLREQLRNADTGQEPITAALLRLPKIFEYPPHGWPDKRVVPSREVWNECVLFIEKEVGPERVDQFRGQTQAVYAALTDDDDGLCKAFNAGPLSNFENVCQMIAILDKPEIINKLKFDDKWFHRLKWHVYEVCCSTPCPNLQKWMCTTVGMPTKNMLKEHGILHFAVTPSENLAHLILRLQFVPYLHTSYNSPLRTALEAMSPLMREDLFAFPYCFEKEMLYIANFERTHQRSKTEWQKAFTVLAARRETSWDNLMCRTKKLAVLVKLYDFSDGNVTRSTRRSLVRRLFKSKHKNQLLKGVAIASKYSEDDDPVELLLLNKSSVANFQEALILFRRFHYERIMDCALNDSHLICIEALFRLGYEPTPLQSQQATQASTKIAKAFKEAENRIVY